MWLGSEFGRLVVVRVSCCMSSILILKTGAPKGYVLSPQLYSLYTHYCTAIHSSNTSVKFVSDTVVLGLISNRDEVAYLDKVVELSLCCQGNNLNQNISKTKEMMLDFIWTRRDFCEIFWDCGGEGQQLQVPWSTHIWHGQSTCSPWFRELDSECLTWDSWRNSKSPLYCKKPAVLLWDLWFLGASLPGTLHPAM